MTTHPKYPWIEAQGIVHYVSSYRCARCGKKKEMGCLSIADGLEFVVPMKAFVKKHSTCKARGKKVRNSSPKPV